MSDRTVLDIFRRDEARDQGGRSRGGLHLASDLATLPERSVAGETARIPLPEATSQGQPTPPEMPGPLATPRLLQIHGAGIGRVYELGGELIIGRDSHSDVVVNDDHVSRRHARVTFAPGGPVTIEDLGSRNGTFVNGVPVTRQVLSVGHRIAVGSRTAFLVSCGTWLEDELCQAQQMEAIGRMTASIVHDFINLLTVISGEGEILRDGLPEGSLLADGLDNLLQATHRGQLLTRQLLAFGRHRIVRQAGGSIEMASQAGRGRME
jgi:pSer/pThr/pTyr-binding forkhead associated (FHA) protein